MDKVSDIGLLENHGLLRSDPERYLALANAFVHQNPSHPDGYFSRHHAWMRLGRPDLALEDLDKSLSIERHHVTLRSRGNVLRRLGRYAEAVDDFDRSEALDPTAWRQAYGPLFRAECHARLGNEAAALSDCDQLYSDHWTPGVRGALAGTKVEVIAQVRRLAASAKRRSAS